MRRPRVFLLSELYWPEEISTGYIVTRIAEYLATDCEIYVFTGPSSRDYRPVNAPPREIRGAVHIIRCKGTRFPKDILFLRLVNLVTRTVSIATAALWYGKPDIVVALTNPPTLPIAARFVAWFRRAEFIIWVHDVYPDVLAVAIGISPRNPLMRLFSAVTRWLFRSADRLVVLGRDVEARLQARFGVSPERLRLIPNWADTDVVKPQLREENELLESLNIAERFVVLVTGNIGRTHGLDALKQLALDLETRDDIVLLIVGYGAMHGEILRFKRDRVLKNIEFADFGTRADSGRLYAACDIALVAVKEGMQGISVPSRLYNILAAGKPLIGVTSPQSELGLVIAEEQVGWVVSPGDGDALCAAVVAAAADQPGQLSAMGARARQAAVEKYGFEHIARQYRALIAEFAELEF